MIITHLHYHLRPGGVTTVIHNAQRALAGTHDVRILAGFGYCEKPANLRREARQLLRQLPQTGLLHTHNIGLGKHPALTYAVQLLAETGRVNIINQVHDFPEDNRPAQLHALRYCTGRRDDHFWKTICYYDRPNVRWTTLTTHDAAKLAARGIPAGKISVLPNPVDDGFFAQAAPPKLPPGIRRPFILCPVKVMARKNNAEAVELIRHLPGYQLVISLDASSPADCAYRDKLLRKIRRDRLPVIIGAGQSLPNPLPLFRAARAILTTSTQEGFGYAFLEGWLAGKLVIGRDLPEVTQDFKAAGLKLDHLYREPDPSAIRRMLARPPRALIAHNRRVVLREYSLAAYARRYEELLRNFTA